MRSVKLRFNTFLSCVGFIVIAILYTSCANIIPPSGGDRDSLPPRLITAVPKDSAVNIFPKQIVLTFDEYITLDNIANNLIISPTLKSTNPVDYKLKNITVKIKDTLDANTTYSLNFGDAIKDVNEGNIKKGFTYVFSTGKTIDYFSYRGKVLLAEKGNVDSTLVVVLHNNLSDTAIKKLRPRYYTRINGKGDFVFNNLAPGSYRVYVVPNGFNRIYDDSTKRFAFKNESLLVNDNIVTDTLYAFEAVKPKESTARTNTNTNDKSKEDKRLKYTTTLEGGQQDLLSVLSFNFNRPLKFIDSSKIILIDTNFISVKGYKISLDTAKTQVSIRYPWKELKYFKLIIGKDAVLDTGGVSLPKTDTLKFATKREADYGSIRLRFINLNLSRNPVLQFYQSDKLVESIPLNGTELIRKLYSAGTYELRVLYDTNKNGKWDTGMFGAKKMQPEIVQLISKPLVIRGNWDNEVNISL